MPEPLKASHIDSKTDPTVANQWDDKTPKSTQIEDFYKTVDGLKIGLLTTMREDIGPVARSMAVAKVRTLTLILSFLFLFSFSLFGLLPFPNELPPYEFKKETC